MLSNSAVTEPKSFGALGHCLIWTMYGMHAVTVTLKLLPQSYDMPTAQCPEHKKHSGTKAAACNMPVIRAG